MAKTPKRSDGTTRKQPAMGKTRLARELRNNPKCRKLINDEMYKIFEDVLPISKRATYKTDSYVQLFLNAGVDNRSVAGYADALQISGSCKYPGGERVNQMLAKMTLESLYKFNRYLQLYIKRLTESGHLPHLCDVAIDFHKIPRYDKNREGRWLLHSKSDKGTTWFETYLTAQIVAPGVRLVLAIEPYVTGDNKAKAVLKVLERAKKLVKIDTLLMDREFFTREIMDTIDKAGVEFLTPCINRQSVIEELRKFASAIGFPNIIQNTITSDTGQKFEYVMYITKRKKPKGDATLPEQKYIGFATNSSDINIEKYSGRWGIETGYRMIGKCRVKTSSENNVVRLFCFMVSCLIFNLWVMLNAMLNGPDWDGTPILTQTAVAVLIQNRGEPPPPS